MIDLRVLGPVRALTGDRDLDIGHARQRSLLAMLLADVNNVVPSNRLAELVWDDRPPRQSRNTLAGYATRLRKVLAAAPGRPALLSQAGGYVLRVDPAAVDLYRFRALASRAAAVRDDEERCALLRSALAQWSGAALGDLMGTRVESLRTMLESERQAALLDYFDAQLRLGRPQEILTQLQQMTEERPYDEELALRLVLAHRDSGNPAAALRTYETVRERLARELATGPGEALRGAGERLLNPGRPSEDGGNALSVATRARDRLRMPQGTGYFAGRERELLELDVLLTPTRAPATAAAPQGSNLAVISGMAGAGKTTLALQWAQRVHSSFPDGQFFVALRGHEPHLPPLEPIETLAQVLLALGLPAADIPFGLDERAALYRTLLVGRRVLLVLDDAAGPGQVRHLLPPSVDGSAVLVTSRERMPGLTATYFAGEVLLDALDATSALALLASLVGSARVASEPEAAAGIVRASGRLPLTVRLSGAYAANHPDEPLGQVLARVPTADSADARGAMGRALDLSYGKLRADQRQLFRQLGVVPGTEFGRDAVAALADGSFALLEERIGALVRANLLSEYAPRRYRLHDMVKEYAVGRASEEDSWEVRRGVLLRLLEWYRQSVERASSANGIQMSGVHRAAGATSLRPAGGPPTEPGDVDHDAHGIRDPGAPHDVHGPGHPDGGDGEVGMAWLDREKANLCAAITLASELGLGPASWRLADAMLGFIRLHPGGDDWSAAVEAAQSAAARAGNQRANTAMLLNIADSRYRKGRYSAERRLAREALTVSRDASWRAGEALSLAVLGRSYWSVGAIGMANRYLGAALRIHESLGDLAGQANALGRLARNAYDTGDPVSALRDFRRSLELAEQAGSRFGQIRLPAYMALTLRQLGQYPEADHWCELAIRSSRDVDFHEGVAIALTCRAALFSDLGEHARAVAAAREAHVAIPHLSDPRIEADCLIRLGGVEAAAEHTDVAMRSFGKALLLADQINYRQGAVRAQAESAATYVRLGLYEEALAAGRRTRRALQGCDMRLVTAQMLVLEADCALASGRCAAAVAGYRRASALYRTAGHRLGEVRALMSWGRAAGTVPGHGRPDRPWHRALRLAGPLAIPEADTLRTLLGAGGR
ncbi:BTAD domain-containing putative transcriptional regulator [Streptomyces sp. B1I3]|uniref:AfsR/SARP family transcriptional regulator n=1 Tax=Streptomyces sp. B1I3 TaxID=3042264 RepID=UPI002788FE9C|nr:BTAD domain-containing putative transcriptional regulator [Streptomyces sp. B1I3]MDQ0795252.1 DNA-binding SARP family transcriptional activator [Streptomyces sp. B1I3]